jgi:aspartate/methionine/tyrosine aminotransferase
VLSQRTSLDRAPNPLAVALERARASGEPLLDLTRSNPTSAGLPYDEPAILGALAERAALVYEPTALGLASARAAVVDVLAERGVTVSTDRVLITASTSEAYGYAFKLLCDAGDEVLVPEPSYPLFDHLARFDGVRPVAYRLAYDGAWHLDIDSIRRAQSPRTRAIVVVSPNNPTGSYLKRSELAALAEIGLPIVSDEVFAEYPLEAPADRMQSALETDAVLVLALGGLSKLAGLPQLKLGWMIAGGPSALAEEAMARLELCSDAYLSVGAPVQHALPRLLEIGRITRSAIQERIADNLATLRRVLDGSAATLLRTEGGWSAVLRLPRTQSEEDWVLGLLDEEKTLVQPGWFYDFAEEPFVVVSLLTPAPELADGAARLRRFVDA